MYEYGHFDGYDYITFDIIETDCERMKITLAVTYIGKINIATQELYEDIKGLYFKYGPLFSKIYLEDFEEVA